MPSTAGVIAHGVPSGVVLRCPRRSRTMARAARKAGLLQTQACGVGLDTFHNAAGMLLYREVAPILLEALDLPPWHQQLHTKIERGLDRLEATSQPPVPLRVLVFARWSRANARVSRACDRYQDGRRWLQPTWQLAPLSLGLKATTGPPMRLEEPPWAVEAGGPRLPPPAARAGPGRANPSGRGPGRCGGSGGGTGGWGAAASARRGRAPRPGGRSGWPGRRHGSSPGGASLAACHR